jgi:UDP-N-acetylmuramyl pentapeptide phosphotransferase/UDP-N-acetylglucosamine-1-phosphate transferase
MSAMQAGAAVVSFITAFAVLRILLSRFASLALDRPNARSLHEHPVPRTGGIAILAGAAVSLGFGGMPLWMPLGAALGLAAVSFFDDLHGIPMIARLAAHIAAAGALVWYVLSPMDPAALVLLGVAVVWITNLYNFMDGSDGLAGGMALTGFGAYGIAAFLAGDPPLATVCGCIATAAGAFLLHNFHPARIFLGDVGSIPLGFLAAALGIVGWRDDAWPLWFPVLVFGPFIGDATLTLLKRALRRERVWRAHREHYYQRLVQSGFGHRGTALVAYAVMLICAAAALAGRDQQPLTQAIIFGGASAGLATIAAWVDLRWRRHLKARAPGPRGWA